MRISACWCVVVGTLALGSGCLADRDLGGFGDGSTSEGAYSPGTAPSSTGSTSAMSSVSDTSATDASVESSGTDESPGLESAESSGTNGAVEVCGDGTKDPSEQCDDGNTQNSDGCNVDCVVSGQELWRISVGAANLIAIGPGDVVHTFRVSNEDTTILSRYDSDGQILDTDVEPIGSAEIVGNSLNGLRVTDDGVPIASATLELETETVEYTFEGAADGWVLQIDRSGLGFDLLDDGTVLGIRGDDPEDAVFQRLSPQGVVQHEVPMNAYRRVFKGPGRTLVTQSETDLVLLDEDGVELWRASSTGTLRGGGVTPQGEILTVSEIGEVFPRQLSLGRWSADGEELDAVMWPDEPSDVRISDAAVDAAGNLVVGLLDEVIKFSPEFEILWEQNVTAWDIAIDSTGAVVVSKNGWLMKLAP